MKKNNIKYNLLTLVLLMSMVFIGCSKDDEYEAPNSFSDVGWYIAYPQSPWPDTLLTNKDDYITFSDLSQNAISHKWEIEKGNFFLKKPIARQDSIFDDKIAGSGSTADKTAAIWFRNSGYNHVRLFNVFSEKVTFRGPNGFRGEAKPVGDNWVIDTTFVVDVYDTIVPKIRVEQKGVVRNHLSATDTIFVEAGDTLEFFDETTTGRPDDWQWNIAGSTSFEQSPSIVLKKLGVFPENTVIMRRAGQNIPGDYERFEIPVPIRVIPSSQPFQLFGAITELENQLIQIPFNGEFAPFVDQEQYFNVTLNGTPNTNFTISINPDDATILDLQFGETIYRSDEIIISYDGSGTLESTDTRSPEPFTETVNMFQHEVIVYDFEDGGVNWTAHSGNLATTVIEPSTEVAASGSYSLKVDAAASGNWSAFENRIDQYSLEAGVTYQIEYKIYKVAGAVINMNGPWIQEDGQAGGGFGNQFWNNTVAGAPADTWVTVSPGGRWAANKTADVFEIYIRHNGQGILYFDDIRVLEADERP